MSDLEILGVIVAAALAIAWGIALLVGVWRIREALVDDEFLTEDLKEGGRPYRVQVFRVRGRYGAIYQVPDGEPVTIQPKLRNYDAALAKARKAVAAS